MEKQIAEEADLIIMPYNYLLKPYYLGKNARKILQNSVILVDEAHNISKAADASASFDLTQSKISNAYNDLATLRATEDVLDTNFDLLSEFFNKLLE